MLKQTLIALLLATPALAPPAWAQSGPPLALPPPAAQQPAAPSPEVTAGLEQALRNFPPMILGANTQATLAGSSLVPPPCPKPGSRVEQKGGPTLEFLGANPANPDLCRMRVAGQEFEAFYGIWGATWPGSGYAYRALQRIQGSRTSDVVGFNTIADPGNAQWHDLIRNEGIEDITILGKTYRALKLAHYREGFGGNTYRSVSTLWRDLETGLPIYGTYQHISGRPEIDDPLIPTAIIPAP